MHVLAQALGYEQFHQRVLVGDAFEGGPLSSSNRKSRERDISISDTPQRISSSRWLPGSDVCASGGIRPRLGGSS